VEPATATAGVLLTVLSRDDEGHEAADPRRTVRLSGLSRIAGSLRTGRWDDPAAEVVALDLVGLRDVLRRRGGCPIYGWEFVDVTGSIDEWGHRLSLDWHYDGAGGHHLTLFQAMGETHHLDLRIWFSELSVVDGTGGPIRLDDFIADGARWWDAMYAGDRSDQAPGIVALGPSRRRWWDRFRRTSE
jgi:hypothetical protein